MNTLRYLKNYEIHAFFLYKKKSVYPKISHLVQPTKFRVCYPRFLIKKSWQKIDKSRHHVLLQQLSLHDNSGYQIKTNQLLSASLSIQTVIVDTLYGHCVSLYGSSLYLIGLFSIRIWSCCDAHRYRKRNTSKFLTFPWDRYENCNVYILFMMTSFLVRNYHFIYIIHRASFLRRNTFSGISNDSNKNTLCQINKLKINKFSKILIKCQVKNDRYRQKNTDKDHSKLGIIPKLFP